MKITVLNRHQLLQLKKIDPPAAIISISSPFSGRVDEGDLSPLVHQDVLAFIPFCFDDVEKEKAGCAQAMSRRDALTVARLAIAWEQVGFKHIICQCPAGLSRSAGVAAALAKFFSDDDSYYFRRYMPNMHVYRSVLDALRTVWDEVTAIRERKSQ